MPVSSPAKLSSVLSEFQGPNNLKAYNRNGPYVPSNSYNNAISTNANNLKLSTFAGARKTLPVQLPASILDVSDNSWHKYTPNLTHHSGAKIVFKGTGEATGQTGRLGGQDPIFSLGNWISGMAATGVEINLTTTSKTPASWPNKSTGGWVGFSSNSTEYAFSIHTTFYWDAWSEPPFGDIIQYNFNIAVRDKASGVALGNFGALIQCLMEV